MTPYGSLPPHCFWKTGVYGQNWARIESIYQKRFPITKQTKILTAGSCFAQHLGSRLRANRFAVIDVEKAPPGLEGQEARAYGYRLFSARYGNIYTARQLLQLMQEALEGRVPGEVVWKKGERFVDALRPNVEPEGLSDPEEVLAHREAHIAAVQRAVKAADLIIFTLGLTEAWVHKPSGTVFPIVPGTAAGGAFDPEKYAFHNFTYEEVLADLIAFIELMRSVRPRVQFLLTVSPVPLAATATGNHVLAATTYSKSVLRAVAGRLCDMLPYVDYFPSYELITAPFSRQSFYDENLREVRPEAVEMVMRTFFRAHGHEPAGRYRPPPLRPKTDTDNDLQQDEDAAVCEEILLEAFAK